MSGRNVTDALQSLGQRVINVGRATCQPGRGCGLCQPVTWRLQVSGERDLPLGFVLSVTLRPRRLVSSGRRATSCHTRPDDESPGDDLARPRSAPGSLLALGARPGLEGVPRSALALEDRLGDVRAVDDEG